MQNSGWMREHQNMYYCHIQSLCTPLRYRKSATYSKPLHYAEASGQPKTSPSGKSPAYLSNTWLDGPHSSSGTYLRQKDLPPPLPRIAGNGTSVHPHTIPLTHSRLLYCHAHPSVQWLLSMGATSSNCALPPAGEISTA
jgi:hypothetical protein